MTDWSKLRVAPSRTHHLDESGAPAYEARFDDVLKYHAPGLAPVLLGEHAWHIHTDGTPAYDARYARTFGFYEGLAAVHGEEGWFHIEPSGAAAYARRHAWCGNFQQGRCTVRGEDGRYHHITPSGAAVSLRWVRIAPGMRNSLPPGTSRCPAIACRIHTARIDCTPLLEYSSPV